jgi:hypothetical protein
MGLDPNRFYNVNSPGVRVYGQPGGEDHLGMQQTLQPMMTKPGRSGRIHNHDAPWTRDHIVFREHATYSFARSDDAVWFNIST